MWSKQQVCSRRILQNRLLIYFHSHNSWLTVGVYMLQCNILFKLKTNDFPLLFIFFFKRQGESRSCVPASDWPTRSLHGKTVFRGNGSIGHLTPFFLHIQHNQLFILICAFRAESLLKKYSRLQQQKDLAQIYGADIGMGIRRGHLDFLNRDRH